MRRLFPETFDEIQIANPARRLGAMVYDGMIILALWMVVGIIAVVINDGKAVTGPGFQTFLFVLTYAFLAFFWTRNGQTLGMAAWRLRVQTTNGESISLTQALIRFMVGLISLLPACAGFLWAFISREKLTWHDMASGTCVVELPKKKK